MGGLWSPRALRLSDVPPAPWECEQITPTTDTGWATYANGSRLFLPAGTNYCTNPSFELDSNSDGLADGWTSASYDHTVVTSRVPALTGSRGQYAQRWQVSGDGSGNATLFCGDMGGCSAGEPFSLSILVDASLVGCASNIALVGGAFSELHILNIPDTGGAVMLALSGVWAQEHAATHLYWFATDVVDGDSLDITIDDVLVGKSSILTPYFDGSYPSCTWSGTANASTSTRTASDLRYGVPGLSLDGVGTVACRVTPLYPSTASTWKTFINVTTATGAGAALQQNFGGVYVTEFDGVNNPFLAVEKVFSTGDVLTCVGRGDGSWLDLNINGVDGTHASDTSTLSALSQMFVGNSHDQNASALSYIGPIIASPYRKSDAWVAAIQANDGAAYNNLNTLWRNYMTSGDMLIPLCSDGIGWVKK